MPFLLTEQRKGWSLIIFLCSRNARPQNGEKRESRHSLYARRGPTIKQWSLDARSGDYASPLAENGHMRIRFRRPHVDQNGCLPKEEKQVRLKESLQAYRKDSRYIFWPVSTKQDSVSSFCQLL